MMSKLWGGGPKDDQEDRPSSSSPARHSRDDGGNPNEHTRLLPNRVESTAYLRPDDPAVTPYNLWSVRLVRYATVFFTVVTVIWWVILITATFVTAPGFHTRGSGFFSFGYATLALANLVFTLVFFAVPSRALRVLSVVIGALLLVDTILLLAVEHTRHEEGWVGMVSVLWALLMSVWTLVTDRLVEWGKSEEEERLTGHAETRRSLKEWLAVLASLFSLLILAIVALLMTATLVLRALDAGLAAPGERYWVDGNKYLMHVYCNGNHTTDKHGDPVPTVLFEGGEEPVEDSLWGFADQALSNGTIGRYCFVDRPGFAWSDTAPSPLSAGMAVEAATEALTKAGEEGPWVLVGAGVGSLYSRIFSVRHGKSIKGLMLVDPLHEEFLDSVGDSTRGFKLWLRGIFSPLGIDRLIGAIFKGHGKEDRVYGFAWKTTGKGIFARLQENLVAGTLSSRDVDTSAAIQNPKTPLVVVSSGDKVKNDEGWEQRQKQLTKVTRNLKSWDVVKGTPHEVWRKGKGRDMLEKRLKDLVEGK